MIKLTDFMMVFIAIGTGNVFMYIMDYIDLINITTDYVLMNGIVCLILAGWILVWLYVKEEVL